MRKLSKAQVAVLAKISWHWRSAYELQVSLPTLRVLFQHKLVEMRYEPGALFFPRNNILFRKAIRTIKAQE